MYSCPVLISVVGWWRWGEVWGGEDCQNVPYHFQVISFALYVSS